MGRGKSRRRVVYARNRGLGLPQLLLFLVGMPVKLRGAVIHRTPWVTWALAALIAASSVAVWSIEPLQPFALQLAFWPELGLPAALPGAVLHVFLHGGWLHLLGNLYFLMLFGRNVECAFGRRRMLGLFFLSALLGALLHGMFTDAGLIGASGGVFGILVFYVCQFPQARVIWAPGLLVRGALLLWARRFLDRGFPVTVYFAVYAGLQLLVLNEQLFYAGQVSALAHLGGGLAGLVIWAAWRARLLP